MELKSIFRGVAIGTVLIGSSLFADDNTVVVPLTEGKVRRPSMKRFSVNKQKEGSFPFACEVGKLSFKIISKTEVLLDRNLDGKLDEQDKPALKRNQIITVMAKRGDKTVKYPIKVMHVTTRRLYLASNNALHGKLGPTPIVVVDSNLDGCIDDKDQVTIGNSTMLPSEPATLYKVINGNIYRVFPSPKSITLTKYTGPVSKVNLELSQEGEFQELWVRNNKLTGILDSKNKDMLLIPGKYQIYRTIFYKLNKDVKPSKPSKRKQRFDARKFAVYLTGRGGNLLVEEGKQSIKVGSPFKLQFNATRPKDAQLQIKTISLIDKMGCKFNASNYSLREKNTLQAFLKLGDTEQKVSSLEYGWGGLCGGSVKIPQEFNNENTELVIKFKMTKTETITSSIKISELKKK